MLLVAAAQGVALVCLVRVASIGVVAGVASLLAACVLPSCVVELSRGRDSIEILAEPGTDDVGTGAARASTYLVDVVASILILSKFRPILDVLRVYEHST